MLKANENEYEEKHIQISISNIVNLTYDLSNREVSFFNYPQTFSFSEKSFNFLLSAGTTFS